MLEKIDEEISVVLVYSAKHRTAIPHTLYWQGKSYRVGEIGYHHKVKDGTTTHHVFELVDNENTMWFRIDLDTSNLHWKLNKVSDGLPN